MSRAGLRLWAAAEQRPAVSAKLEDAGEGRDEAAGAGPVGSASYNGKGTKDDGGMRVGAGDGWFDPQAKSKAGRRYEGDGQANFFKDVTVILVRFRMLHELRHVKATWPPGPCARSRAPPCRGRGRHRAAHGGQGASRGTAKKIGWVHMGKSNGGRRSPNYAAVIFAEPCCMRVHGLHTWSSVSRSVKESGQK